MTIKNTTSIANEQHEKFQLFPNPVSNAKVNIRQDGRDKEVIVKFFDLNGKEVLIHDLNTSQATIDLPSSIKSGVLLYRIEDVYGDVKQSGTLIITK